MEFKIPLFENAIDVLESATMELETYVDWTSDDIELKLLNGAMKRSIQHITNCAELFMKFRLREKGWKYVFENISDASEENKRSGNFLSVKFVKGFRRLKEECDVVMSFENLIELYKIRNSLEHFDIKKDFKLVANALINAIKELITFCTTEIIIVLNDESDKQILKTKLEKLEKVQKDFEELIVSEEYRKA
ncbi:MAG: hypothetical protein E7299_03575 [Lachnospiraceae bacterium]|nr:hypothetical protein [Lachnospiraceae bacterium]